MATSLNTIYRFEMPLSFRLSCHITGPASEDFVSVFVRVGTNQHFVNIYLERGRGFLAHLPTVFECLVFSDLCIIAR